MMNNDCLPKITRLEYRERGNCSLYQKKEILYSYISWTLRPVAAHVWMAANKSLRKSESQVTNPLVQMCK